MADLDHEVGIDELFEVRKNHPTTGGRTVLVFGSSCQELHTPPKPRCGDLSHWLLGTSQALSLAARHRTSNLIGY